MEWGSAEDGGKTKPGGSSAAGAAGWLAWGGGAERAEGAGVVVFAQQEEKEAQVVQARPCLRQAQRAVLHLEPGPHAQQRVAAAPGSGGSQAGGVEGLVRVVGGGGREAGGRR